MGLDLPTNYADSWFGLSASKVSSNAGVEKAPVRLNEHCRCRTKINNAGIGVQNQLYCGIVRFAVGKTVVRRRKILTAVDVG
jgi:hypothetical protein